MKGNLDVENYINVICIQLLFVGEKRIHKSAKSSMGSCYILSTWTTRADDSITSH